MQYPTPLRSLREGVIIRTVEQKPKEVVSKDVEKVGMQNSAAAMENSMSVPQTIRTTT